MHLFYTPDLKDNRYDLSQEESRHCIRVLRLKNGDFVHLTDGMGGLHKARIVGADPKKCSVEIVETQYEYGKRPFHLHVAIAPTKNIKRFEWFLEKATEIGVDEITPLLCFHSERKNLKTDRSKRIITSALKQSLKAYHPVLHEMVGFNDFISSGFKGSRYIACFEAGDAGRLKDLYSPGDDAIIIIGPEGDFSEKEIQTARELGFTSVSLGKSRLRTETAGVMACNIINLLND